MLRRLLPRRSGIAHLLCPVFLLITSAIDALRASACDNKKGRRLRSDTASSGETDSRVYADDDDDLASDTR